MIIEIELPDDTLVGFVSFVYGSSYTLNMGVLSLGTEEITSRKAKYKIDGVNGSDKDIEEWREEQED